MAVSIAAHTKDAASPVDRHFIELLPELNQYGIVLITEGAAWNEELLFLIPVFLLDGSFQHFGDIYKLCLAVLIEPQSELEPFGPEHLIVDCNHHAALIS